VVAEAYTEVGADLNAMLSGILTESYRMRGSEPEIPTNVIALIMPMGEQFVGAQRSLGTVRKSMRPNAT